MSDVEMDEPEASTSGFAYDLDQDPDEKRAVRKNYRSLAKNIEDQQANQLTADNLSTQVLRANELFRQVKGPQEATLDSAFLLAASNLGAQKARALKSGSGAFDVDEFVLKLVNFMGGARMEEQLEDDDAANNTDDEEQLDWTRIGRKAVAKSCRVPVTGFMLGPLSIEQKKRTVTKRAKLEKNKDEMRKPQELKEEDIARSENETSKNVKVLHDLLLNMGEVNLFKFVVNPTDFAQSVENIFHLSFLVRDGKVALDTSDQGEPRIFACDPPSQEDYNEGLRKRQLVFEFDMATWKRAIEVFNITEPLVPQRPPAKTRLGNKWYG
ncbi:Nse4 C-terminal-domain-containing protein [Mycena floridula]|nr:Nse4 C-terminal-domain-containing protein [Mycena floridula]